MPAADERPAEDMEAVPKENQEQLETMSASCVYPSAELGPVRRHELRGYIPVSSGPTRWRRPFKDQVTADVEPAACHLPTTGLATAGLNSFKVEFTQRFDLII